jgi:hypothetical protein
VWCNTPVIQTLERLRQEDLEFEVKLGHIERPCLKNKQVKVGSLTHVYLLSSEISPEVTMQK